MKLTSINGRVDRVGTHNDRNFDYEKAGHIDSSKTSQNKEWNYLGVDNLQFRDAELNFYNYEFSEYLEKVNNYHKQRRSYNALRTMEEYYEKRQTRPEDRIIQVGNIEESIDPDTLWAITKDYLDEFEKRFSSNCKILTIAMHVDESTPHVHIRRVWFAEDNDGYNHVSQKDALNALGFMDKYKDIGVSRFNNAKVDFTKEDRAILAEVVKEYYHKIDISNPIKEEHYSIRSLQVMKDKERKKELEELQERLDRRTEQVRIKENEVEKLLESINEEKAVLELSLNELINFYYNTGYFEDEEEREELEKKNKYEQVLKMRDLFHERIKNVNISYCKDEVER